MAPIPSRQFSPELNLDHAPSARSMPSQASASRSAPLHPVPPQRRAGIKWGWAAAVVATLAAIVAGVLWFGRSGSSAKTPILFLHGWRGNASNFDPMQSLLQEKGGYSPSELNAFHYECPENVDIQDHAGRVADEIVRYSTENGDGAIDIVAHSMGGLVVREILRSYPDAARRIRRLVTLGTPHYGQYNVAGVASSQMRYGSRYLYELARAWTDGYRLPSDNVLSIVGRDGDMDTDGLVDAWSGFLEGSAVRYVNKTHASATHPDGSPTIYKCKDGVNDSVYRLVKAFLKDGTVVPQEDLDSTAPVNVGGSIIFQLVDKSGNPFQSFCRVASVQTETAEGWCDFQEYKTHWAMDAEIQNVVTNLLRSTYAGIQNVMTNSPLDIYAGIQNVMTNSPDSAYAEIQNLITNSLLGIATGQITSNESHRWHDLLSGYQGLPAGTYRIEFREVSENGLSFTSPAIRVDNNHTTVVPIVAEEHGL